MTVHERPCLLITCVKVQKAEARQTRILSTMWQKCRHLCRLLLPLVHTPKGSRAGKAPNNRLQHIRVRATKAATACIMPWCARPTRLPHLGTGPLASIQQEADHADCLCYWLVISESGALTLAYAIGSLSRQSCKAVVFLGSGKPPLTDKCLCAECTAEYGSRRSNLCRDGSRPAAGPLPDTASSSTCSACPTSPAQSAKHTEHASRISSA